jgi:uncharacterized protein (TIGR00290 family)
LKREVSMFRIMITACAAEGLSERMLGRIITPDVIEELKRYNELYGVNPVGEGGEYETAVLQAPLFRQGLNVTFEKVWKGNAGRIRILHVETVDP